MAKKYLDENGLSHFWDKIKAWVSGNYQPKGNYLTSHQSLANVVPTTRKVAGKALTSDITLAKSDVGLGNVDNTADANKSVKYATSAGSVTSTRFDNHAMFLEASGTNKSAEIRLGTYNNVTSANETVEDSGILIKGERGINVTADDPGTVSLSVDTENIVFNISTQILNKTVSLDNKTIAANSVETFELPKGYADTDGIKALAVAGFNLYNATSSGANQSYCFFSKLYVGSDEQVHCAIRNTYSKAAKIRIAVDVMCIKL